MTMLVLLWQFMIISINNNDDNNYTDHFQDFAVYTEPLNAVAFCNSSANSKRNQERSMRVSEKKNMTYLF